MNLNMRKQIHVGHFTRQLTWTLLVNDTIKNLNKNGGVNGVPNKID